MENKRETDSAKPVGSGAGLGGKRKHSPETLAKLSAALKAKWASGTRKPGMFKTLAQDAVCPVCGNPNPPKQGHQSETCSKECGATYRFQKMKKSEKKKWVNIGKRNIKKAIAKQTGAHGFGSVAMDNPNHKNAKWFRVRDPHGRVYEVKNLDSWCRKNEARFVRDDIRGGTTPLWLRASNGLSKVSRGEGCSWYGWTAVCVFDIETDPLSRRAALPPNDQAHPTAADSDRGRH
jgi:predicted nucleic acid-binding Zn ribbon protein